MRMKLVCCWFSCLAVALLMVPVPAVAQSDAAGEAPAMSAAEQEMMAKWQKAMTPGSQHAWLATMAGSWEFSGTFWTAPEAPPTTSTGTAERTVLLGGRVMAEQLSSSMWGMPFEGMGFTGFDNVSGEYWSTWTDNMSTGVMTSTGSCVDQKCTFSGTMNDPMTGQAIAQRMVSHHEADRERHEMYSPGPDGKEMKMMELVYARKK